MVAARRRRGGRRRFGTGFRADFSDRNAQRVGFLQRLRRRRKIARSGRGRFEPGSQSGVQGVDVRRRVRSRRRVRNAWRVEAVSGLPVEFGERIGGAPRRLDFKKPRRRLVERVPSGPGGERIARLDRRPAEQNRVRKTLAVHRQVLVKDLTRRLRRSVDDDFRPRRHVDAVEKPDDLSAVHVAARRRFVVNRLHRLPIDDALRIKPSRVSVVVRNRFVERRAVVQNPLNVRGRQAGNRRQDRTRRRVDVDPADDRRRRTRRREVEQLKNFLRVRVRTVRRERRLDRRSADQNARPDDVERRRQRKTRRNAKIDLRRFEPPSRNRIPVGVLRVDAARRAELPRPNDELRQLLADARRQLLVKKLQVGDVQIDARLAGRVDVFLGAENRQKLLPRNRFRLSASTRAARDRKRRQRTAERGIFARAAVEILDAERKVFVRPVKMQTSNAARQEQLFKENRNGVARTVRQLFVRIIPRFSAVRPRRFVGVDPVENRVGGDLGHPGQLQERVASGARLLRLPSENGVEVQPRRLVDEPVSDAFNFVLFKFRRHDRKSRRRRPSVFQRQQRRGAKITRIVVNAADFLPFLRARFERSDQKRDRRPVDASDERVVSASLRRRALRLHQRQERRAAERQRRDDQRDDQQNDAVAIRSPP